MLKRKYRLTFSNGKGTTKTKLLRGSEKTRYEVYHIVMNTLAQATSWRDFTDELKRNGVTMDIVMRKDGSTKIADILGLRFTKDGKTFKASQSRRGMTYTKMDHIVKRNAQKEQETKTSYQQQTSQSGQPIQEQRPELQKRHDESQQHFLVHPFPFLHWGYSILQIPSKTQKMKPSAVSCNRRRKKREPRL